MYFLLGRKSKLLGRTAFANSISLYS
jgi:hypothetical protein